MFFYYIGNNNKSTYTLSEAWSGVNWADLMAAQGAFGTDFYDRSILRRKHRAYYRSGRPDAGRYLPYLPKRIMISQLFHIHDMHQIKFLNYNFFIVTCESASAYKNT